MRLICFLSLAWFLPQSAFSVTLKGDCLLKISSFSKLELADQLNQFTIGPKDQIVDLTDGSIKIISDSGTLTVDGANCLMDRKGSLKNYVRESLEKIRSATATAHDKHVSDAALRTYKTCAQGYEDLRSFYDEAAPSKTENSTAPGAPTTR